MVESDAGELIRRSTLEQARGNLKEAESLLTRALELREAAGGAHDDDLPVLLRDLSRLCIQQSAHDRAVRPLLQLLAITEGQGAGRPEVATVLATLAAVRHSLGDYASAERLYRKALRIRERTLAPNHIMTASTLESLAETCAGRGRFSDAVSLRKRAAGMREKTLGANDASLRVARKRIADLQLEEEEVLRAATPPRSAPAVQAPPPVEPEPLKRNSIGEAPPKPAMHVPWAAELMAVREEIESTSIADADDRPSGRSALASSQQSRSPMAIAVATGMGLVVLFVGLKTQFGSKPDASAFVMAEPFNPAAQVSAPSAAAAKVPTVSVKLPSDTPTVSPNTNVVRTESPDAGRRAAPPTAVARELPRQQPTTPRVQDAPPAKRTTAALVQSPRPATPVVDSVPARTVAPPAEQPPESRPRSEPANAPVSPALIGTAPEPQYPEGLRDQRVEGDVVVQFVVDETGRVDVSSMTVVRSPHVLLTNAVRAVLPQFRFEPARTAPPQSIARPETVRHTFTFRAPRR
jgi:TonB family protein